MEVRQQNLNPGMVGGSRHQTNSGNWAVASPDFFKGNNMIHWIIALICGGLFAWGGYNFLFARREFMPLLLVGYYISVSHNWWMLSSFTACGVMTLGYGIKSPLRHIFGNGWGRGVWGLLTAIALSLPLLITHHMNIVFFIIYLLLGFILENVLKNIFQLAGDFIIGFAFGSIVFFIY